MGHAKRWTSKEDKIETSRSKRHHRELLVQELNMTDEDKNRNKEIFEKHRINGCLITYDELLTKFKGLIEETEDWAWDEVPEAATTIRIISCIVEQAKARVVQTIEEGNEYMYRLGNEN